MKKDAKFIRPDDLKRMLPLDVKPPFIMVSMDCPRSGFG